MLNKTTPLRLDQFTPIGMINQSSSNKDGVLVENLLRRHYFFYFILKFFEKQKLKESWWKEFVTRFIKIVNNYKMELNYNLTKENFTII